MATLKNDAVKFKTGPEMYPNFVLLKILINDTLIISLIYIYPAPVFTDGRAGSILGRVLGKFQVISSFCPLFGSPGAHPVSNRSEYQRISLGVKCGRRLELAALPPLLCQISN